jgi:DNA modification methylase
MKLYKGDCLEVMDELIEKGVVVDSIITDPP